MAFTKRLTLMSFGFKFGTPPCNYYFDVSFLKNPARESRFGLYSETSKDMVEFIKKQNGCKLIVEKISDLALFLIEQDNDIRIGIGCNAGRHRSKIVCQLVLNQIEKTLSTSDIHIKIFHREESYL